MSKDFFPQRPSVKPMIYAYEDDNPKYAGLLKIGYTTIDVEERVRQQYQTIRPGGKPYNIVFAESAVYLDGGTFMDHQIHYHRQKDMEKIFYFSLYSLHTLSKASTNKSASEKSGKRFKTSFTFFFSSKALATKWLTWKETIPEIP